jgi:hypothetical protein
VCGDVKAHCGENESFQGSNNSRAISFSVRMQGEVKRYFRDGKVKSNEPTSALEDFDRRRARVR